MEKRKRDSLDSDGTSPKRFKNGPTICKTAQEAYKLLRWKKTFVFSPDVITFTLPHDCGSLEHLKRLTRALLDEGNHLQHFKIISGTEIMTHDRVETILRSLENCSTLKLLTISNVAVKFTSLVPLLRKNILLSLVVTSPSGMLLDNSIADIADDLLACTSLVAIDLSGNIGYSIEGIETIITQHESLRIVKLANLKLKSEAMAAIATFMQSSALTKLNISGTELSDENLIKLVQSLEKNKTLTSLNISQTESCKNVGSCKAILKMLKSNNTITSLKMENIPLGGYDAHIIKAIQASDVVKKLRLSIQTQAGVDQLGLALQSLTTLSKLEFDVPERVSFRQLATGVAKNTTLTHIKMIESQYVDLDYNKLDGDLRDEDHSNLRKAFESNRSLLSINLGSILVSCARKVAQRNKEIVTFDRSLIKKFVDNKDWEGMFNFFRTHASNDFLFEDMIDKNHYNLDDYEEALSNFLKKLTSHNKELAAALKNVDTDLHKQSKAISSARSKIEEAKQLIVEYEAQMKTATTARDNLLKSLKDIEQKVRVAVCSQDRAEAEYKSVKEETKYLATLFKRPVQTWSLDEVIMFLRDLQLHKYIEKFTDNELKGDVLVNLTTLDFHQLGMDFKEIKLLMSAMFELKHFKSLSGIPDGMLYWKNAEVINWLQENQFNHLKTKFTTCNITGEDLIVMDNYDLTHWLKIEVIADKTALEAAIKKLRAEFEAPANNGAQKKVPKQFICPITHEIMKDPVSTIDGHTYERTAIESWLKKKSTSPLTNETLASKQLIPNHQLKSLIAEFQG